MSRVEYHEEDIQKVVLKYSNMLFKICLVSLGNEHHAMESGGNYSEKVLIPNIPEDISLLSLDYSSRACIFSLKEFKENGYKDYYFDIYDAETNEDINHQIDSIKIKGEDESLNLIINPNTIII